MKNVRICLFIIIAAIVCFPGCDTGDDYNQASETTREVPTDTGQEDTDSIYYPCRDLYNLPEIDVTVDLIDEDDNLKDMEPEMVAARMYEHAESALDQCFPYDQVEYAYDYAMTRLNKCANTVHTPETIEEWFFEYLRKVVGYDPLRICAGGCGEGTE